jgi:hypothetical protein
MADAFFYRNKWHNRIKTRDGKWKNVPTPARNKAEAKRLGIEFQLHEDRIRLGFEVAPAVNTDARP